MFFSSTKRTVITLISFWVLILFVRARDLYEAIQIPKTHSKVYAIANASATPWESFPVKVVCKWKEFSVQLCAEKLRGMGRYHNLNFKYCVSEYDKLKFSASIESWSLIPLYCTIDESWKLLLEYGNYWLYLRSISLLMIFFIFWMVLPSIIIHHDKKNLSKK